MVQGPTRLHIVFMVRTKNEELVDSERLDVSFTSDPLKY